MAKNTICLWYDRDAEAAARSYVEILRPVTTHPAKRVMC
jgi:predicted 3-demethylubiquinone-9 3-methyltransferase (glyoxalase superfamily)